LQAYRANTRRGRTARLSLSDAELDVILNLVRPLEPELRDPLLQAVALALAKYPPEALGPGLVTRVARPLQREFFRAPAMHDARLSSKYTQTAKRA
jgi:hypothetical protein